MSDEPSYTYYPTVTYDIEDIRKSYVTELMIQLVTKEARAGVIEVDVDGHPGVTAYAPGDGKLRAPSAATLKKFQKQVSAAADALLGDIDGIRQLFANGEAQLLLKKAIGTDKTEEECSDILESLEAGLVDEIQIVDGSKLLVSLYEGDWPEGTAP